jgi:hypothetical protein
MPLRTFMIHGLFKVKIALAGAWKKLIPTLMVDI